MSTLGRQQREFLDAVLAGDDARALDPGRAAYRRTIEATWRAALAGQFPVVERLVGPAFFGEAARHYARAHPSASGNLHDFGARFAAFLETYGPAQGLGYLPDVARLEWALHEAFHAPGAPPFDFAALAQVEPQAHADLRFHLHPAVRLVQSPHPVLAIWEANQPGRDGTPEGDGGPACVLVRRDDEQAWPEALAADAHAFLARCLAGERLGEIADRLSDPESLPELLQAQVAAGTIAGFSR